MANYVLNPGQSFTVTIQGQYTGNVPALLQFNAWVGNGPGSPALGAASWSKGVLLGRDMLPGQSFTASVVLTVPNDAALYGQSGFPLRTGIWQSGGGLISPVSECGTISFPSPAISAVITACGIS